MKKNEIVDIAKPLLRGRFHQIGFLLALIASIELLIKARSQHSFLPFFYYAMSLNILLLVSSLYHRIDWPEKKRMFMRRLDHSAIYLLIAGTGTPIFLILLEKSTGTKLLYISWGAALSGIFFSLIWIKAPKWLNSTIYVISASVILPYIKSILSVFSMGQVWLFLTGAIIYILGSIIYALKRPNFNPKIFGYHELFHIFVLVAASMHFIAIRMML